MDLTDGPISARKIGKYGGSQRVPKGYGFLKNIDTCIQTDNLEWNRWRTLEDIFNDGGARMIGVSNIPICIFLWFLITTHFLNFLMSFSEFDHSRFEVGSRSPVGSAYQRIHSETDGCSNQISKINNCLPDLWLLWKKIEICSRIECMPRKDGITMCGKSVRFQSCILLISEKIEYYHFTGILGLFFLKLRLEVKSNIIFWVRLSWMWERVGTLRY